jgi:Flp pilus assembly protein TadG
MGSELQRFCWAGVGESIARFRVALAGQGERGWGSCLLHNRSGQSLIETALLLPLLLTIVFNAVNIGYFFFVAVNLAAAPRQGAEYSIQGPASHVQSVLAAAPSIGTLVANDFTGAIGSATSTNTSIRVCTAALGLSNRGTSSQVPNCLVTYGSGTFPALTAADADPEAPYLVLNRVDIQYTVTPLIPGTVLNIVFPPSLTFHRSVEMRVME